MPMVMMVLTIMATRPAYIHRTQIDIDHTGDSAQAGLALQAQRLQRNRIVGPADQQVGADADRGIGTYAAEVTGQRHGQADSSAH